MAEKTQTRGDKVRDVHFAVIHKGSAVVDPDELAATVARVYESDEGTERQPGMGGGRGKHVKWLAACRGAALKIWSVPTGKPGPNTHGLNRRNRVGRQRGVHP